MHKVALVLLFLDFSALKESFETFGLVLKQILQYMFQTFVALLPHWGLEKKLTAVLVLGAFLIIASAIGRIVFARKKKKLWLIICSIIEIISSVATLCCFFKEVK